MSAPPGWAAHFDTRQFERFHRLVESFLRQRGVVRQLDDRGVYDDETLSPTLEVHTLAEQCRALAEPQWPIHIARVLGGVVAARAQHQQVAACADFALAKPLLRLELCREQTFLRPAQASDSRHTIATDGPIALRPWLPGLSQGLAMQLEGATSPITQQQLDGWAVSAADAFHQALRNVKCSGMLTPRVHPLKTAHGDTGEVQVLIDGPRFMASHALFVSAYVSEAVDKGVLFVVPHDRLVILHPIRGGAALHAAIERLSAFALRAYQSAPHPLSSSLYWWHDGQFEHLPIEHTEEGMVFSPPSSFVDQVLAPLDAMTPPQ